MKYKEEFERYNIPCDVILQDNQYLFRANHIGKYLKLKNIHSINVSNAEKRILKSVTNGGIQSVLYLTVAGVQELLLKTRKCNARSLAYIFGINLNTESILCEEAQTLDRIKIVFEDEEMIEQYSVGKYRIDLYFPKYKLAIECDEKHHDITCNKINDILREKHIKETLDCSFIRYRPDDDIFKVIHMISLRIRKAHLHELLDTYKHLHDVKLKINQFVHSLFTPTILAHEDILTSKPFRELSKIEGVGLLKSIPPIQ
jgi:hypothetical protein